MSDIRHRVLTATHITEFQLRVYLELLRVPRGKTVTYGELARRIGCRSAQAVGQALKRNPFAPEVKGKGLSIYVLELYFRVLPFLE